MAIDPKRQLGTLDRELTASEQFFDGMVRHQIGLMRVAGSISKEVSELLDATERDIRDQIRNAVASGLGFEAPAQVARLNALLVSLAAIRRDAWRAARRHWLDALREVAKREPAFVDAIIKSSMPVDLDTRLPNARRLRAIVTAQPFEGLTLSQWARKVERDDILRIEQQIRIGLTQGETGPAIARRVVGTVNARGRNGVLQITRNNARGITRTAVNAIANHARQQYHQENARLITGEQYVATLDSRTTLQCASLDGEIFDIGDGPIPPVHFNCRSLRVALADQEAIGERPMKPVTERMLLREFTEQRGIVTSVRRRADLPRGTKASFDRFARTRTRQLIGRVPSKVSYQEFLSRQSATFQNDYLGPTRARLFRQGVPLKKIVDPAGRPIPLSTLARSHAAAFRGAGLDPVGF